MPSAQMTAPAVQALRSGKLDGNWTLDAARSQVSLRSKSMWGLVSVKGAFRQVSGAGAISGEGDVTGTITVGAASIDTGNSKRDEHLRSADFFEASRYPDITVTVDRIVPEGAEVSVRARLTVRGQTRPLAFAATVSSFDADELWLDGVLTVNRGDFGMAWSPMGMASLAVAITVHAVFTRS